MATTAASLNLWSILSESKRIINAHSRHFLALSVIFLLPLSFSLIVSPTILHLLIHSNSPTIHILLRLPQAQAHFKAQAQTNSLNFPFPFPLLLLLSLFLLFIFSLSALATITHSVFHGFLGRPVKLFSAVTSLISSFLPLLVTTILSHLILFSLSIPIPLLSFLLGPSFSLSPITLTASAILLLALIFFIFYLRVSWTLASVISVVENNYGIQPLCRSAALMNGMKSIGASCFLFFASLEGIMLWSGSLLAAVGSDSGSWRDWAFVVQIVLTSTVMMVLMLYNAAANTVLYMYCKAVHGELAYEIAEEFAWQYVSLPFDDSKVPHVVSVVSV
ncbi:polyadenylate-binding protein 1-B-binding protein [Trifolium repens]|nr:polyadenylate-binding protein 1-B-binding protein [Trifolium repens]